MPYRDDREALALAVADLERENADLKEQIGRLEAAAKVRREQDHQRRQKSAPRGCVLCGGSLLPVAVFAGPDHKPIPLSMSTLRFGNPKGGFTRSASVNAKVCSSCGFIHHFMDIAPGAEITEELRIDGGTIEVVEDE